MLFVFLMASLRASPFKNFGSLRVPEYTTNAGPSPAVTPSSGIRLIIVNTQEPNHDPDNYRNGENYGRQPQNNFTLFTIVLRVTVNALPIRQCLFKSINMPANKYAK